jgi:hypothetical protein
MEPLPAEEEELDFSADTAGDDDLDFDIDDAPDDEDLSDESALERELGQSWRSGHPFREDA